MVAIRACRAARLSKGSKIWLFHKNDPQYVAAARELRDRYIEQINAPGSGLLLPPSACGKYDVSRALAPGNEAPSVVMHPVEEVRLLDAA